MKQSTYICLVLVSVLSVRSATARPHWPTTVQPVQTPREIVRVRGELYRMQDGDKATVFLVTPDGILVGDPLDIAAARWLRDELTVRFPGREVRYVVQSFHAFDRAGGARVFSPAIVVAHERFNVSLMTTMRKLPSSLSAADRNRNNRLDSDELDGLPRRAELLLYDLNGDGLLYPGELYNPVSYAVKRYVSGAKIELGGKAVEIVNPGGKYRADTVAMFFPDERVLFSPANPGVTSAPFSLGRHNVRDVLAWMRAVAPLGFDTLVSGRGETVTRADFDALMMYLNELVDAVIAGYRSGLSVQQIQARPMLDKYRGSVHDRGRNANIAAMYDTLRIVRTDIDAAATMRWASANSGYCGSSDSCESGGSTPAGTVGISVGGRRLGGVLELTLGRQLTSHRESTFYDDVFAHRSTRGSLLFGYGGKGPTEKTYQFLVGPSIIVGDSRGLNRVKGGYAPFAGRHPISGRSTVLGATAGVNLVVPVKNHLHLLVPLRFTVTPLKPADLSPGRFDLQAGIGFRFEVLQRFR